ncbi:MAG: CBS domain-containing protein [Planctomycetales bacterium]|nr:CBS domain-containing protein [Planctomycetales bacterium]
MSAESVDRLDLREPVLCGRLETIRQAVERMRRKHLGCVIALDADGTGLGIFTEGMLTELLCKQGAAVLDEVVSDHLMNPWPHVLKSDPISRVLEEMQANNTRFIGVLDEAGQVVGLTGQKGLMEYVSEHFPQQVMVQRVGSKPPSEREGA